MGLLNDVGQMKFDVRLTDWNLKHGQLSKEEIQKHLQSLPDDSGKCLPLSLEDTDDEMSGDGPH